MKIRNYDSGTDYAGLRERVVELQDFEHNIDPRLPGGEEIADDYITQMLIRCGSCDGQVMVADVDGEVGGYVTLLNRLQSEELHEGDTEYGLIADLVVKESLRGEGIGRKLMSAAETAAREFGVRWLRVSVMQKNTNARNLYTSSGFSELYSEFEKELK